MKPALLATFLLCLFSTSKLLAQKQACLQGSEKNRQYHDFVNQDTGLNDPRLIAHFQKSMAAVATRLETVQNNIGEHSCYRSGASLSMQVLYMEHLSSLANPPLIEPRCSFGAMNRESSQMTYFCDKDPQGKPRITKLGFSGPNGPCMSTDVAAYVSWSINEAIACMSPPRNPIDPSLIFKKINNETGFNFGIAYGGGHGIGQLTSAAIQEINTNTDYIDKVVSSTNPHCAPFKNALKLRPTGVRNKCDWIEPSEGFARNIIYSLAYYLRIRDHYLIHGEHKVMANLKAYKITNPDYANLIALSAYGREGWNAFPGMLAAAKAHPKNYQDFVSAAMNASAYIDETEQKYAEVIFKGTDKYFCAPKQTSRLSTAN